MHVSFAEFRRIATEPLRMLGTDYGQADDALDGLVWAQAVLRRGYELVFAADGHADRSNSLRSCVRSRSPGRASVEMNNWPLLLYGQRVADLAIGLMSENREMQLEIQGSYGAWMLPFIVQQLAKQGYDALGEWRTEPANEAPVVLSSVAPATPAGQPTTVSLLFDRQAASTGALARGYGVFRLGLRRCSETNAAVPVRPHQGWVSLTLAPEESLAETARIGMEVDEEDHRRLLGIASRIRVPSSERSRSQAG